MRVRVDELGNKRRVFGLDLDRQWAVQAVAEALDGEVEALAGTLSLRALSGGVMVSGDLRAVVRRACDRCLSAVHHTLGGDLDLYFEAEPLAGDVNVSLTPDELDVGFTERGELDLAAVISEFFVLESSARLRCGDPGVRRLEPGDCSVGTTDEESVPVAASPFGALKDFEA